MQKKLIKKQIFSKRYTKKQFQQHILQEVDNLKFQEHCIQVSKNLNVDVTVVRELLLHNSFTVLSLIQQSILENKEVKINITGYIIFVTSLIKYRIKHLSFLNKYNKFY